MFRCPEFNPSINCIGCHRPECEDRYRWERVEGIGNRGLTAHEVPAAEPEPEWTRRQWETVKRLEAMNIYQGKKLAEHMAKRPRDSAY